MTGPPAGPVAKRLDPAAARGVLIILAVIALMVQYVETMVIPAIVRFETFFQLGPGGLPTVTWILTAYLLAGTVATPVFSKLGDIVGKRHMLLVTMTVYTIAVSVAGFTPNIASALGWTRPQAVYLFIGVRAVQGIGIAMFPLAFAMIGEQFPPQEIGLAQGIIASMFAAGASLGLFGGAWITNTFGWQLTYHTVIPVAVGSLIAAFLILPESPIRHRVPLDIGGAAALGVGLGGILVALSEGPTWGWTNWAAISPAGVPLGVPVFALLGLIGIGAFLIVEPRVRAPIVDFARLKERNIWISNVVGLTTAAAMFLIFVAMTEIIQVPTSAYGLGQSIFVSGLLFLPSTLVMLVFGPMIGFALPRLGPKPFMVLGGVLVGLGGALLFVFNRTPLEFALAPMPALIGMVMCFIAMTNVVVLAAKPQEIAIVTGMNQTFRNVGMALGPALAATILTSFTFSWVVPGSFGTVALPLPRLVGYEYAFLTTAILGAVGAVLSLFLRNYRISADGAFTHAPAPGGAGTPATAPAAGPTPELAR